MPVQSAGTRPPLWSIHPVGGSVLWLRHMLPALPPGQPLYGIQARGMDGEGEPFASIPEMAGHYVTLVRQVQPHGPYFLSGASFGGTVAFEMAQQLRQAGEAIGLLALFESYGPGYPERPRLWQRLRNLSDKSWSERMAAVNRRLLAPFSFELRDIAGTNLVEGVRRVIEANFRAMHAYRHARYEGEIVLFRATIHASELGTGFEHPTNGWSRVSPEVRVIDVEGDHRYLLDPPAVHELAPRLADVLAQAQATAVSP